MIPSTSSLWQMPSSAKLGSPRPRRSCCLRGAGRILRGRTPDLSRQELWAHLARYQAIRVVICLAGRPSEWPFDVPFL